MDRMVVIRMSALSSLRLSKLTILCGNLNKMVQKLDVPHSARVQAFEVGLQSVLTSFS